MWCQKLLITGINRNATNPFLVSRRSEATDRVSTWGVPSPGVIKINTDAIYNDLAGVASMAVIIRNEMGKLLDGFYYKRPLLSALAGEALAMQVGVLMAKVKGYR